MPVKTALKLWSVVDERGMTQQELAKLTGYSQPHISYMRSGRREIPLPFRRICAKEFGMSEAELFATDSTPTNPATVQPGGNINNFSTNGKEAKS